MKQELDTSKNSAGQIVVITVLFSIAYVVLRYHIFGDVLWKDLPFFIFNKGISLAAFILLTYNFTFGPLRNLGVKMPETWLNARSILGMTGFVLVFIHVFMSFLLFSSARYANFYEPDGTLTLLAGLSMLGGTLAFVVLWIYNLSFQTQLRKNKSFIKFITSRKFLLWAILFSGVHLFFMGYKGWLNPAGWHGGMPPVSLVAFTFFVFGYFINILGRK